MARLGPFEPAPALAAAVSGGPDSMALALLARDWVRDRGGDLVALVVDHRLRANSASEACLTMARLAEARIAARILVLDGLAHGPGLAARARTARYAALTAACAEAGILHLLLGHQAADQAETVLMRRRAGSGADGRAGMAALVETPQLRLLRPLLAVAPARLRALLAAAGLGWVDDPSNRDPAALRSRLRAELDDATVERPATVALLAAADAAGAARAAAEAARADLLARRVRLDPRGWALLSGGPIEPSALAALLRTVGGRAYPPPTAAVAALAAAPRPATLAGVRLLPAGRLGRPGDWLVFREAAAMAAPVPARAGAVWDRRFRLLGEGGADVTLGAVGPAASALRRAGDLPAAVLATLPALWRDGRLLALAVGGPGGVLPGAVFAPQLPLAGAPFVTMR